jgi:hypothetical protein
MHKPFCFSLLEILSNAMFYFQIDPLGPLKRVAERFFQILIISYLKASKNLELIHIFHNKVVKHFETFIVPTEVMI